MLTGVAKKLAAQFFHSVDDVLTGAVAAQPKKAGAMAPAVSAGAGETAGREQFFPAGPPQAVVGGVALGALAALSGVVIGWLMGRSGRRQDK
jgi:hypothetical protein